MKKKKILIVDDSNTALMMERMALQRTLCEIITARDGEEAVAVATREIPDLILMDVVMPKLSGFDAVRKLREQAATREIPIILVTTRAEVHNVQNGFASGCNDYITKPINSLELITKVKNFLGE